MAQTVSIIVFPEDRTGLAAISGDRNRPQKHVQRAQIVLYSAERQQAAEIARLSAGRRFFAEITGRQIKRGAHRSERELEEAILAYIAIRNEDPKPFKWGQDGRRYLGRREPVLFADLRHQFWGVSLTRDTGCCVLSTPACVVEFLNNVWRLVSWQQGCPVTRKCKQEQ